MSSRIVGNLRARAAVMARVHLGNGLSNTGHYCCTSASLGYWAIFSFKWPSDEITDKGTKATETDREK